MVVSAVALSEKVPDPALRPHGFTLEVGELLDLDETVAEARRRRLRARRPGRGPRPVRGPRRPARHLPRDRGARGPRRPVRRSRSSRCAGSPRSPSARSARRQRVEIAPAAELAAEHRELAEIAALEDADERPDVAELLPVDHFRELLDLLPEHADVVIAADEDVEPALRDHWDDVCAAFHDADAHHLYVKPDGDPRGARRARSRCACRRISGSQPLEFRAQAAEFAARSLREAEPELEKLMRSGYTTLVTWPQPRRGRARRLQPRSALRAALGRHDERPRLPAEANLRDGFVAPAAEARRDPRAPADPPPRPASSGPTRRGRGLLRTFADLRTGDIVVHEDHGVARFAGFDTKTVAGVTRDYLNLEFQGSDKVFMPVDQLAKISRYVGADGDAPAALQARRHALGDDEGARPPRRPGARRRAAQPLRRAPAAAAATRSRPTPTGCASSRPRSPTARRPTSARRSSTSSADMEAERPMDRLICGDVGYGKTEVALRAAFKAANAGKQVLMLVPTTILAQQHFGTFTERLRDYPFTIEHVCRFRPPAEQRAAVKALQPRARSTSSSAPTGCSRATCAPRTSGC